MAEAEAATVAKVACEEGEWQRKKKKKKEAKEKESQEAKAQEEEEKRKEWEQKSKDDEFWAITWLKLADIVQLEKYEVEHLALKKYRRRHVGKRQMQSPNLDDHSAYLTAICQDQSLYLHANVMLCSNLIELLRDHGQVKEADEAQKVVDDELSSFTAARVTVDSDVKPLWLIRVLQ